MILPTTLLLAWRVFLPTVDRKCALCAVFVHERGSMHTRAQPSLGWVRGELEGVTARHDAVEARERRAARRLGCGRRGEGARRGGTAVAIAARQTRCFHNHKWTDRVSSGLPIGLQEDFKPNRGSVDESRIVHDMMATACMTTLRIKL